MLRRSIVAVATIAMIAFPVAARAQSPQPAPGALHPGDHVDADYLGNGTWIPATVLEVENDGYDYKLHGDPYHNGRGNDFILNFKRVRPATAAVTTAASRPAPARTPAGAPLPGKYGCTQSLYSTSGYQIEQRGFLVFGADGSYRYLGVGKPGRWTYDAKSGVTSFAHGYMDGATATAVDGRRDRLFFTPYSTSAHKLRWTCTRVS